MNYTTARLMLKVAAKHGSVTIGRTPSALTDVDFGRRIGRPPVIVFLPGWQILDR